jgi:hypothetical protein
MDQTKEQVGRACGMHGRYEKFIHFRNLKGNRPLGRLRHRCEFTKTDLNEIGCEGVHWIQLMQDIAISRLF